MLELRDITYTIEKDGEDLDLLHKISLKLHPGHFMAVVGPSGCGKTTLMKIITGLLLETEGEVWWRGKNLADDGELHPSELGYVPQFSIAYDHLTVDECVENAIRLRVKTANSDALYDLADSVITQVGMESMREKFVKVLSGGQKRRLGLAMELVSNPTLLLCDEVTSGLDPKSEREIVHLMHALSQQHGRIVMNITHSLANLELYDSVLVLHEGKVVYHGPPDKIGHYFSVQSAEEIYPWLGRRPSARWHESWSKYRPQYYAVLERRHRARKGGESSTAAPDANEVAEAVTLPSPSRPQPSQPFSLPAGHTAVDNDTPDNTDAAATEVAAGTAAAPKIRLTRKKRKRDHDEFAEEQQRDAAPDETEAQEEAVARLPGMLRQFFVLFSRRWKLFFRDRTQLVLQIALLVIFPLLVIIFAPNGVEKPPSLTADESQDVVERMETYRVNAERNTKAGGLVSGLVMFQVILLTLMGSNNAAREIAGERLIYEKERLGGVRPAGYVLSKVFFLGLLVTAQSCWMALFVDLFCQLDGDFVSRMKLLIYVNAAMTFVCLGISAAMRSADQASLLSIYLVGFQLPLSGAVLKMPGWLEPLSQPLIAAYWSWGGQMKVISEAAGGKFQAGIRWAVPTSPFPSMDTASIVLLLHVAVGLTLAYCFCKRRLWD
ncbi:MAG: ATP-binding cassette domain-containing protein [Verrucomicrobiales bacterium]|nr:ATP-binding cassette domain-containing protein [Verrucomicrobiales bacterium]